MFYSQDLKNRTISFHGGAVTVTSQVMTTQMFRVQNKMTREILNNIFKVKAIQYLGKMFGAFHIS